MATISLDKISSSCETALKNHLILSRIFQYLDLTSLKAVRLVCKNWDVEAIKKFRNFDIIIRLEPPFESEKWEHLQRLLNLRDDFHPILFLSFQSPAWVYYSLISQFGAFEFENENFQKVWATLNDVLNSNFEPRQTSCDFRVFELLTQIGVCVRELRLELTLLNETDAEYVVQLLSAFPNLEKFYLDIVDVGDEGLLGFPLITTPPDNSTPTGFLPPSLVTLGLRIYGEPDEDESHITVGGHGVSLDAVTHFMKTCSISNIQLLDFEGWAYQDLLPQDEVVKMMWMTAI
ncbi:uncharacterized protein LOC110848971 isoform X1 [Folsomia candida]|uniref:uncharacterized protein LOC110848971 isoform X1 n=1 Tax=Folsomia candida TaxID=158441 RepID=UPI001604DE4F|nr:uncharacterized protein LOC110848971 isoform X1 [Folsomia candida]XP_035707494.1 uncharacterized protein LOC110848971 isoform X1 [Folsomia candida]